jgi:acetate kinase
MKILVLNAGSSSLKYQLLSMPEWDVLSKWLVDKIGLEWSLIKHSWKSGKVEIQWNLENHSVALKKVLALLVDPTDGVLQSLEEIDAAWHRVVHGWEHFVSSSKVDADAKQKIDELSELAPLHNPANLMGIYAVEEVLPNIPNIAVFDTSFHQTMEPSAYMYSIPYKYYEKYKIRRYGFHGTSHKYVSYRAAEILGKDIKDLKIIVCHVGNGASVSAIEYGKVIDTSMGFTPLEGLTMGTRCWNLDPAIVSFLMKKEWLTADQVDHILNKESWVLGISGTSSDMRDIEDGHIANNSKEKLALEIYVHKILKYIGSYVALLNGCDVVVLTAGTLENSAYIRKMIADKLAWLGISLDESKNTFRGEERIISTPDSKAVLMVVPTNEEYMIAKETYDLLK